MFEIGSNKKALNISGEFNKNIKHISKLFKVKINLKGNSFQIEGEDDNINNIESFFNKLNELINSGFELSYDKIDDLYYFHTTSAFA